MGIQTSVHFLFSLHSKGECIAGAMYWVDFVNLAKECGFGTPRLVTASTMTIDNKALEEAVGTFVILYLIFLFRNKGIEFCRN